MWRASENPPEQGALTRVVLTDLCVPIRPTRTLDHEPDRRKAWVVIRILHARPERTPGRWVAEPMWLVRSSREQKDTE